MSLEFIILSLSFIFFSFSLLNEFRLVFKLQVISFFSFFFCSNLLQGSFGLVGLVFFVSSLWTLVIMLFGVDLRGQSSSKAVQLCSFIIVVIGWFFISARGLFFTVFGFELMTLFALALLRLTSKGERGSEALIEMYSWAMIGSFFLILSLTLSTLSPFLSSLGSPIISFLLLVGFAIKIPLWPFSSWLLKAHVEASTEFSIFLSGFLVKFGVVGLAKINNEFFDSSLSFYVLSLSFLGLFEAMWRMFAQVDLKRIIALLTIVETNWLTLCLFSGCPGLQQIGLSLILVHTFTTTMEFSLVEFIYKRFGTKSIIGISGLGQSFPNLNIVSWLTCLTTIGLPGSSIFILKLLFFIMFFQVSPVILIFVATLFLVILPCFIIRIFSCISGGTASNKKLKALSDLSLGESLVFIIAFSLSCFVGFYPIFLIS